MRIVCIVMTYCLFAASFGTYLGELQRARYKPLAAFSSRHAIVTGAFLVYNVLLGVLWARYLPEPAWSGVYLVAAFLPATIYCILRIKTICFKPTWRLVRLWGLAAVLAAAPAVVAAVRYRFTVLWGIWGALGYPTTLLAAAVTYPLETARNNAFIKKQKKRLRESGVCVIGVTGSAGKTTIKRLLCAALGEGAYGTEGNYNTPMGIALSVREMPRASRWFIAEMGVGKPNDMRELLDLVTPKIGIVGRILPQHTRNFARQEDIRQEKCRLLDAVEWGICHASVGYPAHCTYGDGGDWWAEDVQLHKDGTEFIICSKRSADHVSLPLLGRQTVENALCAWAVARHLGMAPADIEKRWSSVEGEAHRLQVSRNAKGIWIVDDSYNCNIKGAEYALEYIALYEGRKIVTTSGIDESDERLRLNERLGEMIADTADIAVIVGARYRRQIEEGLAGRIPLYFAATTEQSRELYGRILKTGDVLLIMADYPMGEGE